MLSRAARNIKKNVLPALMAGKTACLLQMMEAAGIEPASGSPKPEYLHA